MKSSMKTKRNRSPGISPVRSGLTSLNFRTSDLSLAGRIPAHLCPVGFKLSLAQILIVFWERPGGQVKRGRASESRGHHASRHIRRPSHGPPTIRSSVPRRTAPLPLPTSSAITPASQQLPSSPECGIRTAPARRSFPSCAALRSRSQDRFGSFPPTQPRVNRFTTSAVVNAPESSASSLTLPCAFLPPALSWRLTCSLPAAASSAPTLPPSHFPSTTRTRVLNSASGDVRSFFPLAVDRLRILTCSVSR